MARIVTNKTSSGSLTAKIDISKIVKLKNKLEEMQKGDILIRAARHLQEEALIVVANKYFQTQSNRIYNNKKYLKKSSRYKLEKRLFESALPAPVRKGSNVIEIKFWEGFSKLSKDLPHLKWQEEGVKANIDEQPYIVVSPKKLGNIRKANAKGRKILGTWNPSQKRKFYHAHEIGSIVKLRVRHPSLPARKFIAAGNLFVKRSGNKLIREFIAKELGEINA